MAECLATRQQLNLLDNDHPARKLKKVWANLAHKQVPNGRIIIFQGTRVVPPDTMVPELLQSLHKKHSSASSMVDAVHMSYYWPGYKASIYEYIKSRRVCGEVRRLNSQL